MMIVTIITFRVSRRRREMYCGHSAHSRLRVCVCVCVCVCLSVCPCGRMPTLLHGPGCNLVTCPLVVHYWADLQSVRGLRCYCNITRNVSEYYFRYMPNFYSEQRRQTAY